MRKENQSGSKGVCLGTVFSNDPIRSGFWKILFQLDAEGSRLFATANPGQFAEFDLNSISLPPIESIPEHLRDISIRQIILRRPFSFSDISTSYSSEGTCVKIEVFYCVLGPATVRMTTLKKGDQISILGPLGNGFSYPDKMDTALLVTGGMGAPPILHLAAFLKQRYPQVRRTAFAGAKTMEAMPFHMRIGNKTGIVIEEFDRLGVNTLISTDDGSGGRKGFVTDLVHQWIQANRPNPEQTVIYACGPEPMLAQCDAIARQENLSCQVSMERRMACGIGLCQSCAVQIRQPNSAEPLYKLCCKEGPVFDSRKVLFKNSHS